MVDLDDLQPQEALKLCKNSKCCSKYFLYMETPKDGEKQLVPLNKVDIKASLRASSATTCVELTYINSTESSMECTYVFPLDKHTILSKFEAEFDDKVVYTKIMDKTSAQEQYTDAVASGKAAVYVESKNKEETITFKLGNLLPGQKATLKATIATTMEIVGGSYAYLLPVAFYPDYKKHGLTKLSSFPYKFAFEAKIESIIPIFNLHYPKNAYVASQNATKTQFVVKLNKPSRTIDIYYRTADMLMPQMFFARKLDSNKVACSASLVPTFDILLPQDMCEMVEGEKPEQAVLGEGNEFHFIFIIDRSGSMSLNNRMEVAIQALDLFIRSLPKGCKFSIISFGSYWEAIQPSVMDYNDETSRESIEKLKQFEADLEGTEILQPLQDAQENFYSGLKKRIFLLTDGCVSDPENVIEQARLHAETMRVFTFGLGSDCDKQLVSKVARAGRGTYTIVNDGASDLNGQVVRALSNAMQPSLQEAQWGWNGDLLNEEELFRNTCVNSTILIDEDKFNDVIFQFRAKASEGADEIDLLFTAHDFVELQDPTAANVLFQMAASNEIKNSESTITRKELSIKYQVLCDDTAMVGILQQNNLSSGEMQEITIQFGREKFKPHPELFVSDEDYDDQDSDSEQEEQESDSDSPMSKAMNKAAGFSAALPAPSAPQAVNRGQAIPLSQSFQVKYGPSRGGNSNQVITNPFDWLRAIFDHDFPHTLKKYKAAPENVKAQFDQALGEPFFAKKNQALSWLALLEDDEEAMSDFKNKLTPVMTLLATLQKPTFYEVIQGQTSDGNWDAISRDILAKCIKGPQIEDVAVMQALNQVQIRVKKETAYLTLLAIYILEEAFQDQEAEWTLIVRKAKTFLEQQAGIPKPTNLVAKFTLALCE